jgi:hypothetical protein
MTEALPRLDTNPEIRQKLLPYCRLKPGEIWTDPRGRHAVAVADARDPESMAGLVRAIDGTHPVCWLLIRRITSRWAGGEVSSFSQAISRHTLISVANGSPPASASLMKMPTYISGWEQIRMTVFNPFRILC